MHPRRGLRWRRDRRCQVGGVLSQPGVEAMLKRAAEETSQTIDEASAAFVKAERPISIIQRTATPEEVANMVISVAPTWLPPPPALRVDGGVVDTIA